LAPFAAFCSFQVDASPNGWSVGDTGFFGFKAATVA
jgi:hypothetical protein